jgi:hypothetical protein
VYGFFRRDRRAMPAWRVVAAPVLACGGLAVMIVLVCVHLDLLTGASAGVNAALILPLPVLFGAGMGLALRVKGRDPAAYERLTTVDAERV